MLGIWTKDLFFFFTFKDLKEINMYNYNKYSKRSNKVFTELWFFFWFWWVFLQGELFVFKAEGKLALPTQIRKGPTDDFELNLNG